MTPSPAHAPSAYILHSRTAIGIRTRTAASRSPAYRTCSQLCCPHVTASSLHTFRYMATAGIDGTLKLWDIRTFKPLHAYNTPRTVGSIDISDTGMLAAVSGPHVQVRLSLVSEALERISCHAPGRRTFERFKPTLTQTGLYRNPYRYTYCTPSLASSGTRRGTSC